MDTEQQELWRCVLDALLGRPLPYRTLTTQADRRVMRLMAMLGRVCSQWASLIYERLRSVRDVVIVVASLHETNTYSTYSESLVPWLVRRCVNIRALVIEGDRRPGSCEMSLPLCAMPLQSLTIKNCRISSDDLRRVAPSLTRLVCLQGSVMHCSTLNILNQLRYLELDWYGDRLVSGAEVISLPHLRELRINGDCLLIRFAFYVLQRLDTLWLKHKEPLWPDALVSLTALRTLNLQCPVARGKDPRALEKTLNCLPLLQGLMLGCEVNTPTMPISARLLGQLTALQPPLSFTDTHLQACTSLQTLALVDRSLVTVQGLSQMTWLTALKTQRGGPCNLHYKYVMAAQQLPRLCAVTMDNPYGISQRMCESLHALTGLKQLSIYSSGCIDASLDLTRFSMLQTLELRGNFTLPRLLPCLITLTLDRDRYTTFDDVVVHTQLQHLYCDRWHIPPGFCDCRNEKCGRAHI